MKDGPWDIFIKDSATKEVSEQRYSVCKECDQLMAVTKQCKKCWCVMPVKVTVSTATCPLNKW